MTDDFRRVRNRENINKAIKYLKELKENESIQEHLEVSLTVDESTFYQNVVICISLDVEKIDI